jgi:zinc transport system substrate-binding protein
MSIRVRDRTLAFAAMAALLCGPLVAGGRLRIVTTIFPLQEFARAVAGERAAVDIILPPGAGIHNWQPRPGDMIRLASSDLFIFLGLDLEPWAGGLLASVRGKGPARLEAAAGLDLPELEEEPAHAGAEHEHGAVDPHVWLDPLVDLRIVDRIAEALCGLDPEASAAYRANAEVYKEQLLELDGLYRDSLKACRGATMVIAGHAAFGYLAARYGLRQMALYGLSPDAQLSPGAMREAVEFCRGRGLKTVFFENTVSRSAAETLAREIGGRVLVLRPGHNLTREDMAAGLTFLDIMKENLRSIKEGLGCR